MWSTIIRLGDTKRSVRHNGVGSIDSRLIQVKFKTFKVDSISSLIAIG